MAVEKYLSTVHSTGATTSVPMSLVTVTSSDGNSSLNLKLVHPFRNASKTQTARGTVDIATPQVAAALYIFTNIPNRKLHIYFLRLHLQDC